MAENSGTRIKRWVAMRLPFLWLVLSIFFASYFPAVSRYSVNTLFNNQKRGYFDFLFTSLQFRGSSKSDSWIRLFGIILLVCYAFRVIFRTLSISYTERVKQNSRKITGEKFGVGEAAEWTRSFSDRIVDDFISFFSCFCELFIDLWAVININRTREIRGLFLVKTFFCLVLMSCSMLIIENITRREEEEEVEEKLKFPSIIVKVQQQLVFSELSIIFTAFYFILFPKDSEIINAVLLGFNISSVLGKLRRFVQVAPRAASTYKMYRQTKNLYVTKSLPADELI